MKKAVSILVSAIALLSIVFVAIFGTQPQGIVPIIYVESMRIKPIDESNYKVNNDGQPYCTISYDENKEVTDGENSYMPYIFSTEILPKEATNQSFIYYLDNNYKDFMNFPVDNPLANKKGAFLIKRRKDVKKTIVIINVKPLDGGKCKGDSLMVILDYKSGFKS